MISTLINWNLINYFATKFLMKFGLIKLLNFGQFKLAQTSGINMISRSRYLSIAKTVGYLWTRGKCWWDSFSAITNGIVWHEGERMRDNVPRKRPRVTLALRVYSKDLSSVAYESGKLLWSIVTADSYGIISQYYAGKFFSWIISVRR